MVETPGTGGMGGVRTDHVENEEVGTWKGRDNILGGRWKKKGYSKAAKFTMEEGGGAMAFFLAEDGRLRQGQRSRGRADGERAKGSVLNKLQKVLLY